MTAAVDVAASDAVRDEAASVEAEVAKYAERAAEEAAAGDDETIPRMRSQTAYYKPAS
eukprot:CAMPEP_0202899380 /NCGR_PEP_ID=MMETSP1392-20130828/7636_1 /ASSEMBLY_ACC=CAM_ASM_000868 /TAXON_ID=225041 /ORGANISM="Chlamydomonas chlamydogama, Strain SAG 11-48b" /LENGTH=57 /DNA_ID=CAMNT_0049585547 /DNA_START=1096 /DNA_END=1270 /DNA_ORIENTATION=-